MTARPPPFKSPKNFSPSYQFHFERIKVALRVYEKELLVEARGF